jgi:hypothetical protein
MNQLEHAYREQAFRTACRLIKEGGSSPYKNWKFTLELAEWLLAGEKDTARPFILRED